ncbi:hypothetical protein [Halomonas sp. OfavH-34-E]|uniref:SDH family Clp fold serine proteinase n=1 Tax=Halomonas sp. OfavH-34-E TaxID=2954491 RepID=UPI0020971DB4|nr:hypothetical protein [Halomonas sp. OfavH-34-E]MCO7214134.1 hypothetical protein [Halomonas sp. OfavH-34-E]
MGSYETFLLSDGENAQGDSNSPSGEAPPSPVDVVRRALLALDADLFIYSGSIMAPHDRKLIEVIDQVPAQHKKSTAILWLTTWGGSPDAAYTMARAFQRSYDNFYVLVTSYCKSSGTLICLGAEKLFMTATAELGPLDIQVANNEELGERLSGLNPSEALNAIGQQSLELLRSHFLEFRFNGGLSTRQALEVATNLTGQLMSPITGQLDIMKYGEFIRAMRIAREYGDRLSKHHGGDNLKPHAVQKLTNGYPSHGFAIDKEEAENQLFSSVEQPGGALECLVGVIKEACEKHLFKSVGTDPMIHDAKAFFDIYDLLEQQASDIASADDTAEREEDDDDGHLTEAAESGQPQAEDAEQQSKDS